MNKPLIPLNPLWYSSVLALEVPNYSQWQQWLQWLQRFQPLTRLISWSESSIPIPITTSIPLCRVNLCHTRPHRQHRHQPLSQSVQFQFHHHHYNQFLISFILPSLPLSFPFTFPSAARFNKVKVQVEVEGEEEILIPFYQRIQHFSSLSSSIAFLALWEANLVSLFKRLRTQIIALRTCHRPP